MLGPLNSPGLPKIPGWVAVPVDAGFCCVKSGETGAHAMVRVDPSRQERANGDSEYLNHADGGESGAESGREPLPAAVEIYSWPTLRPDGRLARVPSPEPPLRAYVRDRRDQPIVLRMAIGVRRREDDGGPA